jgi:hypothetical protein
MGSDGVESTGFIHGCKQHSEAFGLMGWSMGGPAFRLLRDRYIL